MNLTFEHRPMSASSANVEFEKFLWNHKLASGSLFPACARAADTNGCKWRKRTTGPLQCFAESMKRSRSLFLRDSGRKTGFYLSWNCSGREAACREPTRVWCSGRERIRPSDHYSPGRDAGPRGSGSTSAPLTSSSCGSEIRSTETTFSPAAVLKIFTPFVARLAMRMPSTGTRMT